MTTHKYFTARSPRTSVGRSALILVALAGTLATQGAFAGPLMIDAHADVLDPLEEVGKRTTIDAGTAVDLDKMREAGLGGVFLSVHAPLRALTPAGEMAMRATADAKMAAIKNIALRHPDKAALAMSPDDLRTIAASGRTAIMLGLLNGEPYASDPDALDHLYKNGVRMVGFVHAGNNSLADSSRPFSRDTPNANGGLTDLGRKWVADANRLGMMLDVSQLTDDGVMQTVELSQAPVIASHVGVRSMVDHPRGLADEEMKAIANKGGAICIVTFSLYLINFSDEQKAAMQQVLDRYGGLPNGYEGLTVARRKALYADLKMVQPEATIAQYVDSVDQAVKKVGIDHVCLSTDFNHGSAGLQGLSTEGDLPKITEELRRRGYSDSDISALWSGNVLRVWQGAEAVGRKIRAGELSPAPELRRIVTDSPWEKRLGYSRAVVAGDLVFVSATAPIDENGSVVGKGDTYLQARAAFAKIKAALADAGTTLERSVQTRIYLSDMKRWEGVGRAHKETFGDNGPAMSLVHVAPFSNPDMLLEVELVALKGH